MSPCQQSSEPESSRPPIDTRPIRHRQEAWAATPLADRLEVVRAFRYLLAEGAEELAGSVRVDGCRLPGETLVAEVLPLVEACRHLERRARRLLAPRRLGAWRRPAWLFGTVAEIRREPFGLVLILCPSNYPLFLPGVQALQALATGNAVILKPAPGCREPLERLGGLFHRAGLPEGLFTVVGEGVGDAEAVMDAGVDKVVLTGSAATGRNVLARLAPHLTPAVMELSGSDPVFVLPDADLELVADALAYGLGLNGGRTCIAPRRVFVPRRLGAALEAALARRLSGSRSFPLSSRVTGQVDRLVAGAEARGCRFVPERPQPGRGAMQPVALFGARQALDLLGEDLFAPLLSVVEVDDEEDALALASRSRYALGASVFGPEPEAMALAGRIDAGSVVVNDLIVPTADPRLPFGGRRESGFGVTRGDEGLLEMTAVKAVSRRRGRFRPHYDPATAADGPLFAGYLQFAHGRGVASRATAGRNLLRLLAKSGRFGRKPSRAGSGE